MVAGARGSIRTIFTEDDFIMWLLPASLVLVSALMHAGWNLIVKGEDDKLIGAWITVVGSPFIVAPFIVFVGLPPAPVWPIVVVSAATHAVYMVTLARAYEHGHLSVVYPVSRGVAPVLVACSATFVLGEQLPPPAVAAIALAGGGIIWLGFSSGSTPDQGMAGVGWALVTACVIALYTTVDKIGVTRSNPVAYAIALWTFDALFLTPYVLAVRRPHELVAAWRRRRYVWLISSVFCVGSYLLVLIAMRMMPVSYIAALRESSVVFGALLGWHVLGEAFGRQRLAASATVAAGLILLSLTAGP